MKTMKLAVVFAFFISVLAQAQDDFAFKVLVNKGKSEVKNGSNWQAIKVGSALKPNDELNVHENSYVGLVHANGKPLELKKPGKYSVAKLSGQVTGEATVLNKYTDFILSSNSSKKNNLVATGAIHRGSELPVFLPGKEKNQGVYSDEIIINWDKGKGEGPYTVRLMTMWDDELGKFDTKDTKLKINLADNNLASEDNILVIVSSKSGGESDKFSIKKLSAAEKEKIKADYAQIAAGIDETSAIGNYVKAGFFEEHGLLIDATTAFQKAVELEPTYKEDYNTFLLRTGLKQPPATK